MVQTVSGASLAPAFLSPTPVGRFPPEPLCRPHRRGLRQDLVLAAWPLPVGTLLDKATPRQAGLATAKHLPRPVLGSRSIPGPRFPVHRPQACPARLRVRSEGTGILRPTTVLPAAEDLQGRDGQDGTRLHQGTGNNPVLARGREARLGDLPEAQAVRVHLADHLEAQGGLPAVGDSQRRRSASCVPPARRNKRWVRFR